MKYILVISGILVIFVLLAFYVLYMCLTFNNIKCKTKTKKKVTFNESKNTIRIIE
jgi:uncharacterized membrane protein